MNPTAGSMNRRDEIVRQLVRDVVELRSWESEPQYDDLELGRLHYLVLGDAATYIIDHLLIGEWQPVVTALEACDRLLSEDDIDADELVETAFIESLTNGLLSRGVDPNRVLDRAVGLPLVRKMLELHLR